MPDWREANRDDVSPDLLGRRVRRAQLRIGLLELAQLPDQGVVLGVRDHRRVEHVVAVVGVGDLFGQVRVPVLGRVVGLSDGGG